MMHRLVTILCLLLLPLNGLAQVKAPVARPAVLTDLQGKAVEVFRSDDRAATVLLFVVRDCPISNAFAPEIHRIVADYKPRKVSFFVVYIDVDTTLADLRQHYTDFGYNCPALYDKWHLLVKRWKAQRTPEAVVIDKGGTVVYQGRIDDRYIDFGKQKHAPESRDLRFALQALLSGQKITATKTPVIGCPIPD